MKDRWTRVLLGPYRSGKSVALLTELTKHCREDVLAQGDALLIVPSKRYQRLVERRILKLLRKEFAEYETPADGLNGFECVEGEEEEGAPEITLPSGPRRGYVGLNVASFYQACSMILRRCGVVPRVIPEAVRPALVARVLSELKQEGKLEHLLPIVDFVGTHSALLDLIDELERSGLSPADVIARLQSSASQSSRHYELALVYRGYWEELDRIGYLDNRRVAFKCREVLAARNSGEPLFGFVGIDGFDRFNHLQLQVLRELSDHTRKSIVCFDYNQEETDDARREYMWKDTSFDDLKRIFNHASFLWSDGDESTMSARAPMEAFKTVDRFLEMEEIARKVKHSLVVKQIPADELLVVVPSLRDYKGAIEAAFDDAGVPYFVDEPIRMMTLPIVQFAVSLLSAFENDFSRSVIVRAISSRFFKRASFNLTSENINSLDRLSQKEKLIGGRSEWLRIAEGLKLDSSIKALFDCLTPPDSTAPLTTFVSWCEDVLSLCLSFDYDAEYQDPVQGWTEERALIEIQNLWASLVQEDAILYGDRGGFKSDYHGFLKKLSHAFEKANFRGAPAASNSVIISSVDLADSRRFDEVFLAGLVEGEFPRRLGGRGFVSPDEVKRWEMFGVDIRSPRMHPAFEFALFRSLIDRARKQVYLSYPMWDMSGEELLPSFFLTGEALPVNVVEAPPFKHALRAPVSERNQLAGILWNQGFDADTIDSAPLIRDLFGKLEDSVAMVQARTQGMLESPFNGYLVESVESGALSVDLPSRFSASRLNEYGKCPFRYWMSHVLKLTPFEEATVKLEVRELGETYHLALEKFYGILIDRRISLACSDREVIEKHFDESIEEALAWLEKKRGANYSEFWDYEKKEIVFRLKRFLDKEIDRATKSKIDYVPQMVEAAFGMNDNDPAVSAPALKVTDGVRTVEFRGKIDRIDIAGGLSTCDRINETGDSKGVSTRVIDYKAGSSAISSREANEGRNLQLPIYAMAVERCILPGSRSAAGAYLSFTSGAPIGSLKFEREKEDDRGFVDIQRIEKYILDYVEKMAHGVFTVKPSVASVCDNCDHKRVCRVSELKKGGAKNVDISN
jgi:ATP-dependent helicase/DNAse subunit B